MLTRARVQLQALPGGTIPIAVGVLVNGVASYVFLTLPARTGRLDTADYSLLSTIWFAVFVLGPGLFVPLEQTLTRAVAARRAQGGADHDLVHAAVTTVGRMSLGAAVLVFVVGLPVAGFGSWSALCVIAGAVASFGALQALRGVASGRSAFGAYGSALAGEGVARVVLATVLVVAGVSEPVAYGAVLVVSPLLAVALVVATSSRSEPRIEARGVMSHDGDTAATEGLSGYGALLIAQVGAQALANSVPLALAAMADDEAARSLAGALAAGFVLSRVPLFLFQAVQAALLPALTADVVAGELRRAFDGLIRLERLLAVGRLRASAGLVTLGPWAVETFFGEDFRVGASDMTWFCLGAAAFVVAFLHHQVLVATEQVRVAAQRWVAGLVGFTVLTAGGWVLGVGSDVGRVEVAYTVSTVATALVLRRLAVQALSSPAPR